MHRGLSLDGFRDSREARPVSRSAGGSPSGPPLFCDKKEGVRGLPGQVQGGSPARVAKFLAKSIALVAIAVCPVGGTRAQAADYFAGKTITAIVGVVPGGSIEAFIRLVIGSFQKHIPGRPNIIVQNMPGAGGLLATNYLAERARPDGLSFFWGAWDPLAQALDNPSLRVRYDKLDFLGGIGDVRILYARTDTVPGGITKPTDIMKAERVIVGAPSATEWTGLLSVQAVDVLGLKQKIISGYRGGTDVFLALQRGEVQFHNTSIASYNTRVVPLIKAGSMAALAYLVPVAADGRFTRNDTLPGVLAFPDLYHEIHGRAPSGPAWDALNWLGEQTGEMAYVGFLPPGTPAHITATLREAFVKAFHEPEFVAQSTAQNGVPYRIVTVAHGDATIRALAGVAPAVLANLREKMDQIGR